MAAKNDIKAFCFLQTTLEKNNSGGSMILQMHFQMKRLSICTSQSNPKSTFKIFSFNLLTVIVVIAFQSHK